MMTYPLDKKELHYFYSTKECTKSTGRRSTVPTKGDKFAFCAMMKEKDKNIT
jgi:hypothetical protein